MRIRLTRFLCTVSLLAATAQAGAVPTSFGPVIGQALLCLSELDAGFFYDYMVHAFGAPYKHEGNGYWFKAQGTLWGAPVVEILVSDKDSSQRFIAAVIEMTPEALAQTIADNIHVRFTPTSAYPNPVRVSQAGSNIVYYQQRAKIFCAKSRYLMPD